MSEYRYGSHTVFSIHLHVVDSCGRTDFGFNECIMAECSAWKLGTTEFVYMYARFERIYKEKDIKERPKNTL
jgi:hypothetical protein